MKTMKQILALVLGFCLLLGTLAGCGSDPNDETVPGSNNHEVTEITGTVMLNVNACVDISFDSEGNVLNVQEVDHDGHELLSDYAGYLQTSCAEVVKDLVGISQDLELLNSEFNYIVIKQAPDSKLPSETFLTDLAAAAEEAADIPVSVTVITAEELDENGNIQAKKAYDLLQNALHIDKFELVESDEQITDGVYAFNVVAGSVEGVYLVDAATGYVYEGSFETEDPDQEYTEEDEEEKIDSTTEDSQPSSEESLPEDNASQEENTVSQEENSDLAE